MNMQVLAKDTTNATTNEFFGKISTALESIYSGISGIFSLVAVVAVAICSVGMLASKNQRTVEEFKSWRSRVIITWLIFNMLGILVNFGTSLTEGMQYDIA